MKAGSLALVGMAVLLATPSGLSARGRVGEGNSVTYTPFAVLMDQAGPVISTIVVSSDDTSITFQINTPNRPSFTSDMLYGIFVDTDNTPSTGSQTEGGADVLLQVSGFRHPIGLQSSFWDGVDWRGLPLGANETWAYSNGSLTVTVPRTAVEASRSDTGPTQSITFGVVVWSGLVYDSTSENYDFTNAHHNDAPYELGGFYPYDFEPGTTSTPSTPPSISTSSFKVSKARAGKVFTASMLVTDDQSGHPAITVQVTCVARVGSKKLQVVGKSVSAAGRATCSWRLPQGTHGKRLTGTIIASFPGITDVSRSFGARIV